MYSALQNLLKNWTTALPTALTMGLILTLFHSLLVLQGRAEQVLQDIAHKFSITVYVKESAAALELADLVRVLEKHPDVTEVAYLSSQEAWNRMNQTFRLAPDLAKAYRFSLPASLVIRPKTPGTAPGIEQFLHEHYAHLLRDPAEESPDENSIAHRMTQFLLSVESAVKRTIFFFLVLFMAAGTLLVSGTIHLALSSREAEIHIMKFVGASLQKITLPFVAEGVILGALAFLVHLLLLGFLPLALEPRTVLLNALLLEFLAAAFLGGVASFCTVSFHFRKKSP